MSFSVVLFFQMTTMTSACYKCLCWGKIASVSTVAFLDLIAIDKFRRYYQSINHKQWIAPAIAFISEQADAREIQADANELELVSWFLFVLYFGQLVLLSILLVILILQINIQSLKQKKLVTIIFKISLAFLVFGTIAELWLYNMEIGDINKTLTSKVPQKLIELMHSASATSIERLQSELNCTLDYLPNATIHYYLTQTGLCTELTTHSTMQFDALSTVWTVTQLIVLVIIGITKCIGLRECAEKLAKIANKLCGTEAEHNVRQSLLESNDDASAVVPNTPTIASEHSMEMALVAIPIQSSSNVDAVVEVDETQPIDNNDVAEEERGHG